MSLTKPDDLFEQSSDANPDEAFVVDVDGFEGPLDLLLTLARSQKVDLGRISVLALADQYLVFIAEAKSKRLELAADYLVMAAWLAYLKSRLLLPNPPKGEEPSGADLAEQLAVKLKRLALIREAANVMMSRRLLGRDVFKRGMPEQFAVRQDVIWHASLYDLLKAYGDMRQVQALSTVRVAKREVWSLADARALIERFFGETQDWTSLDQFLIDYLADPAQRATLRASSFASTLEMAREGHIELQQSGPFAPLYLRKRRVASSDGAGEDG